MKPNSHDNEQKRPFRLDEMPKKHPYTVPQGYFDELPGIIQAKTTSKPKSQTIWNWLIQPSNSWKVGLATAVIALVLVFSGLFTNEIEHSNFDELMADISTEEILDFIELEYPDLTTDEIIAELDLVDFGDEYLFESGSGIMTDDELDDLDMDLLYEEFGIDELNENVF